MTSDATGADQQVPAISVVVPLYNKRPEVERAIRAILGQAFRDFELIVVDDGSDDGSADLVESIDDDRIRLIRQGNAGVSVARNRGIQEARAELIAFSDADDEWLPNFLTLIWDLYSRFPAAGMYGTAYEWHLENDEVRSLHMPTLPPSPWSGVIENYFRTSLDDAPIWSSAAAVRRAVFDDVGYFPAGVRMGEDLDMWLRIALRYPVAYNNSVAAIYHRTASNQVTKEQKCNKRLILADTAATAIVNRQVPQDQLADLHEYVHKYQLITAKECAQAGDLSHARQMLKACASTKRYRKTWLWWRTWTALPRPLFNLAWKGKRMLSATGSS